MSKKGLIQLFNKAFEKFLINERNNIGSNVSERSLCTRLAFYIEELLSEFQLRDYFTDTEYNRKQNGEIKTILDEKLEIIPINCDIILHSRGINMKKDNLIAIEMKKS